jgi:putative ABC transport system permease protein
MENTPRDSWLVRSIGGTLTDVRQAARGLWKTPGFTAVTLLTLALCIGANTAIFSMVYGLLLKALPYSESERIVELYTSAVKAGLNKMPANVPFYMDYSKNATSYDSLALWTLRTGMFGEDASAQRQTGASATAEIFGLLRVQPLIGNFFTKENNKQGADKVAVLMQSFWQTQYNEDPGVIGKMLRLDGENYQIVGVAPRIFEAFDARVKFLLPLSWPQQQENPQGRYGVGIQLYGRLKPGVPIGQADAEAKMLESRYYETMPPAGKQFVDRSGMTMNVGGVQEQRVQPVRPTMFLLQGGVAFVLLIGCVNVANLLLVRSNARQSELAIRFTLGAGRAVIARQLIMESLLLTTLGAAIGIGLAWAALYGVNHFTKEMLPSALPMALDRNVLMFAVGITLLVGIAIGLVPVTHLLTTNLTQLITSSSRSASAGRGARTISSVLVMGQVAFALILLTGAGLLINGFVRALGVDPGLDPKNVVVGRVALPATYRASDEAAKNVRDRIEQALKELPGVTSTAFGFATPFQGGLPINALTLEQDTLPPGAPQPGAFRVQVTPGYAETLKLRLVEGRFYEEADRAPGKRVFVVDETFAKKFFPGRSALGGRFIFGNRPTKPEDWPTIIGVVKDVPHNGVEEKSGNPFIYQLVGANGRFGGFNIFVRTPRSAPDVIAQLREKLHAIDPAIALFDTGPLESFVDSSFNNRRGVMLLLATFAGLALFLSALGIYGVLAYDVSQRTREIGIRGALGATREQVIGLILRQGLWKAVIGLVVGLIGAFVLSHYMTTLLFQVKPTDPLTYAAVSLLLLAVAALASYLPARRAAKINPMEALRVE